jgi:hypothetical protein
MQQDYQKSLQIVTLKEPHPITITAILYFNDQGQLINFRSDDRTAINDMKQYPFFTPAADYQNINGINVMTHGETIWGYPDGNFTYGKFVLKDIQYNPSNSSRHHL